MSGDLYEIMDALCWRAETTELIRVARLITPASEVDRWILTMDNRRWTLNFDPVEGGLFWGSVNAADSARFDDADFRHYLYEQLHRYGITSEDAWTAAQMEF